MLNPAQVTEKSTVRRSWGTALFLSDSMENVRTSLDYYILFILNNVSSKYP